MPGLFDDNNSQAPSGGGILQGIFRGIGGALNPEIYRQNALEQAYRQNGFDPATAHAMAVDPQAASGIMGQRIMQQNYRDLISSGVPQGLAGMIATHPEMLTKLGETQKFGPGEAPYNALAGMLGTAPNASQQQPPSSQPAGGGNSFPGQAIPGMGPVNNVGQINPQAIHNMVIRRLKGDTEVVSELGGGMGGGIGAINRKNFQDDLERTMKAGDPEAGVAPMTAADLVSRDAKFPAYKEATKKNADISSQMQLAQTEALGILPYLKQAASKLTPSDYPIFNAANQAWQAQTGNPASAELASYMNAMINTYSRGISSRGQGPTVNDKKHLQEVLNPAWSNGQWEAGTNAIINELGVANDAIHKNQNRIDVQYGFGKNTNPADEANARAALAKGANRQEVIRRFEEGGFNAPKF